METSKRIEALRRPLPSRQCAPGNGMNGIMAVSELYRMTVRLDVCIFAFHDALKR